MTLMITAAALVLLQTVDAGPKDTRLATVTIDGGALATGPEVPRLATVTIEGGSGIECSFDDQELSAPGNQTVSLLSTSAIRCGTADGGLVSVFAPDGSLLFDGGNLTPATSVQVKSVGGEDTATYQGSPIFSVSRNEVITAWFDGGSLLLNVEKSSIQVSLSLSALPPSRVQCSLERLARHNHRQGNGLTQHQAEWDPAGSLSVARTVELTPGNWSVLCRSDPQPGAKNVDQAWKFGAPRACTNAAACIGIEAVGSSAELAITSSTLPDLKAAKAGLKNLQATSVTRSTGAGLEFVATDLAQLLAEIAYTRARGRAADLLKRRLVAELCEDVLSSNSEFGGKLLPVSSRELGSRPLLSATCDAIAALPLEDLAGAGRSLVLALRKDAVSLAFAVLADHLSVELVEVAGVSPSSRRALARVLRATSKLVTDQLSGVRSPNTRDAQLVLISLAQADFAAERNPSAGACLLDLGLAIAAQCHDHGGCDAAEVAQRTLHPNDNINIGNRCNQRLNALFASASDEERGQLQRFVLKALELADPPHDATNLTMLKSSADLTFTAVELLLPRLPAGDDKARWTFAMLETVPECRGVRPTQFLTSTIAASSTAAVLAEVASRISQIVVPDEACATALIKTRWTFAVLDTLEECRGLRPTRFITSSIEGPSPEAVLGKIATRIGEVGVSDPDCSAALAALVKSGKPPAWPVSGVTRKSASPTRAASETTWPEADRIALVHNLRFVAETSRGLVTALVDNDAQSAVTGISRILSCAADWNSGGEFGTTGCRAIGTSVSGAEGISKAVARATPFLAALAGYAAALPNKDAPDSQANRDARAKAIESFIDASTRREGRGRDWVFSLGSLVGPAGFFHASEKPPPGVPALFPFALTMPMGVALDWLPAGKCEGCIFGYRLSSKVGLHFQLSLLDLAQFLTVKEDGSVLAAKPEWTNALLFGAQAGLLIGYPDINVNLGVDVRWTPSVYPRSPQLIPDGPIPAADKFGLWRIGAVIGVYVPFFDFN